MSRLIFQREGDWVRLLGPANRKFTEFLKYSLKPASVRKYDTTVGAWMVYWTTLRTVAPMARAYYLAVDWSTLPEDWQLFLAGADLPAPLESTPVTDLYSVLFVTEDAPPEVIRAAYKALAGIYHPDVGGSVEKMTQLNEAYLKIRGLTEH